MLTEQRDHEPKCILFVLLEMHKSSASYKVHALGVPDRFRLNLTIASPDFKDRGCSENLVKHQLAGLVLSKKLKLRESAPDIFANLSQTWPFKVPYI